VSALLVLSLVFKRVCIGETREFRGSERETPRVAVKLLPIVYVFLFFLFFSSFFRFEHSRVSSIPRDRGSCRKVAEIFVRILINVHLSQLMHVLSRREREKRQLLFTYVKECAKNILFLSVCCFEDPIKIF